MRAYRGTGVATLFRPTMRRAQTQVVPLRIEAEDQASAREQAEAQIAQQYPAFDGYTYVIDLAEVVGSK